LFLVAKNIPAATSNKAIIDVINEMVLPVFTTSGSNEFHGSTFYAFNFPPNLFLIKCSKTMHGSRHDSFTSRVVLF
jgi:hypothetical protein